MLFLGSPFPWSPGHIVMETEYLIQKKIISNDNEAYNFPLFRGPVSVCFEMVYGDYLRKTYNVNLITNHSEITEVINDTNTEDIYGISMSHSQFVKDKNINGIEYRENSNAKSLYSTLGGRNIIEYTGSTALVNSITNNFSCNQYKHIDNKQLLPSIDAGIIENLIPGIKAPGKIVLINIREHVANANGATTLEDYKPLISYCKSKGYQIIDVSHEKKTFSDEIEKLGVIAYWKFENKNFIYDIDLFSKADFYVGTGGPTHLALALRIPTIWVAGLTPTPLPTQYGYQIPMSLHRKNDLKRLEIDESTGELLGLRNAWEEGYDCWSNTWGPGNPYNCMEELKTRYRVYKPSGLEILKTFMELEDRVEKGIKQDFTNLSQKHDLFGEAYIGMQMSPYW